MLTDDEIAADREFIRTTVDAMEMAERASDRWPKALDQIATLRADLTASQREVERLRHGEATAEDGVCPDAVEVVRLRAECLTAHDAGRAFEHERVITPFIAEQERTLGVLAAENDKIRAEVERCRELIVALTTNACSGAACSRVSALVDLKPFIRYYGGKWRAAPRYPAPHFDTIVEPFAGAAGYSMRYHTRKVILVEKYPTLAEMWRYLIGVTADEIRRIPIVEAIADLPAWVPAGARTLVGFTLNAGVVAPCNVLSAGRKKLRAMGRSHEGWSEAQRERCAAQVDHIRHWRIIEGDYRDAPDVPATWFVDPPYQGRAGDYYKEPARALDFEALGTWCRMRRGQVMVCENDGATWLPFVPFMSAKAFSRAGEDRRSAEALWYRDACAHAFVNTRDGTCVFCGNAPTISPR